MEELTDYEARIVREIAAWKAQPLSHYQRVVARVTKPFAWGLGHVIPEAAARAAVETAYATSKWLAGTGDLPARAGVASIAELRHKSLELSDGLADRVGQESQTVAAVDGAVAGVGGVLFSVADVGTLAVVALRAIHRTGQCYGFSLDRPEDRPYVLGILMVAGVKSSSERLEFLGRLQRVERWALAEAVEAAAMSRISQQLIEVASLEAVPGIGIVLGGTTNVVFIRQVLTASRHVFQRRWLHGNGKVQIIAPAELE